MKNISLLIVVSIIVIKTSAQIAEPEFLNKPNQHSVSTEFAAISYSYAHKFKSNVTFGVRIQSGYGMQIMLASTSIRYDFGYGNGPVIIKPKGYSNEILKFQIFYRRSISNSFYFDLGPVASFTPFGESGWENQFNIGIETSVYYSIWKMHIGFRLRGALNFDPYNSDGITSDNAYFALYATPLVVGFNF